MLLDVSDPQQEHDDHKVQSGDKLGSGVETDCTTSESEESQDNDCIQSCKSSVWEAQAEDGEDSDACELGLEYADLEVEADSEADCEAELRETWELEGLEWEEFHVEDNILVSEEVLPTICEDELLQAPLPRPRSLVGETDAEDGDGDVEPWSGLEVLGGSFRLIGSVAVGLLEATHELFSCSSAFDAMVQMHLTDEVAGESL
eukprot:TRINITY_DN61725_c0_g1_i1.p1 TRINITY_DN61725_c0_g1~~TRINITY_DN61725_c0_g1_i1.p1  ORF type:complete len:203 (+),score=52.41 TRINITY_DN61725_c0_g1_i1:146-754(+)